jgi:hypothetical protein
MRNIGSNCIRDFDCVMPCSLIMQDVMCVNNKVRHPAALLHCTACI